MLASRTQFLVKQQARVLHLTGAYDILDPDTQAVLGTVVEQPPTWAKFLRLLVNKGFLPTSVVVTEAGSATPYMRLDKAPGFLTYTVRVRNAAGQEIGAFRTKAFSFRSKLLLYAPNGQQMGELGGDWKGWDFTLRDAGGRALGTIAKKWAGMAKEFFSTADTYLVRVADGVPESANAAGLLLAAGLAVDLALKEHSG